MMLLSMEYISKDIVEYLRCDKCKCKIEDGSYYFAVMTGHRDWCEDSCDSVEHQEFCEKCVIPFTKEYLKKGSKTKYIDIEQEFFRKYESEYDECDPGNALVEEDDAA